ncbi:MAG: ATP-binding cassette domain-containing protein [Candidatus Margulisbacteria bacterium]|nr:ATP-binding cassette domain-containing protein [Candidatus Margulisiibacteriota bacterium]
MIRLRNVTKKYQDFVVLNHINLHIAKDEFVFLVGPTGAGKTTILSLLTREQTPESGKIYMGMTSINELNEKQVSNLRKNIGFVFQDFKILNRTIYENLAYVLKIQGERKKIIVEKIERVAELVGLESKLHCYPYQLSGGEQQKACIARAIINKPPVLLADEPTGNLDPDASLEIIQLMSKINLDNTTVVVATHDKAIVDLMRKRVIALHGGNIIRDQQMGSYHEC